MSKITVELDRLASAYPLPRGWQISTKLVEERIVAHTPLYLVGLVAESEGQQQISASAGSIRGDYKALALRAYFELIERVAILELVSKPTEMHEVSSFDGKTLSLFSSKEVFLENPEPQRWTYAKSNGVAAHSDRDLACWHAYRELLERAIVLRSWYGGNAPRAITLPAVIPPLEQRRFSNSNLALYEFNLPSDGLSCLGAFVNSAPGFFLYGFSSARNREDAALGAIDELFQRVGFLAEETVAVTPPEFSPSPDYHQEFYLSSQGTQYLQQWLAGKFAASSPLVSPPFPAIKQCMFVDCTPRELRGKCWVVKAFHQEIPPLTFGHHPAHLRQGAADIIPHPIV
jgi:hypothetical protein